MTKKTAVTMVLLVLLALGACSAQDSPADRAASSAGKTSATSEADETAPGSMESGGRLRVGAQDARDSEAVAAAAPDAGTAQRSVPEFPSVPQGGGVPGRVIKNISLEIRIKEDEFQRQFARAGSLAEQFGGFVTHSQAVESEGRLASGTLTIRVPSDRFEEAVSRLKDLGRVTAEDRSGQDVSKEFVDLEARLRQAKAEEAFFLRLMDEADGISDMIQIQSQLSSVQMRIEQIQGQLNYLNDQTSFSTITVRVYEPGASEFGPPKGFAAAWEGALDGFQSVIGGLVVAVGWLAPFALIGLAGLLVFRLKNRPKTPVASEVPPPAQS